MLDRVQPMKGHASFASQDLPVCCRAARNCNTSAVIRRNVGYMFYERLAAVAVLLVLSSSCFATPRRSQKPLSENRERSGMGMHTHVKRGYSLSEEGRATLAAVTQAGRSGDWQHVRLLYSRYKGCELPVLHAVMHHAYNCGQFRAGADVYRRICDLEILRDSPTFATAMKVFSKLGQSEMVQKIWLESKQTCMLDELLAAARITTAATDGDVETAASVLDEMNRTGLSIDVGHVTSAIRACWAAEGRRENAATYLFQLLLDRGLTPNIATYTCLIGSYSQASLDKILSAYHEMKELSIAPDPAFAETYLCSVLHPVPPERNDEQVVAELRAKSPDRLAAALEAVEDFQNAEVKLTALSARIARSLRMLAQEWTKGLNSVSALPSAY